MVGAEGSTKLGVNYNIFANNSNVTSLAKKKKHFFLLSIKTL